MTPLASRHLGSGLELASSFNLNPHKLLPVGLDCSVTWFRAPFDGAARISNVMLDGDRTLMSSEEG